MWVHRIDGYKKNLSEPNSQKGVLLPWTIPFRKPEGQKSAMTHIRNISDHITYFLTPFKLLKVLPTAPDCTTNAHYLETLGSGKCNGNYDKLI